MNWMLGFLLGGSVPSDMRWTCRVSNQLPPHDSFLRIQDMTLLKCIKSWPINTLFHPLVTNKLQKAFLSNITQSKASQSVSIRPSDWSLFLAQQIMLSMWHYFIIAKWGFYRLDWPKTYIFTSGVITRNRNYNESFHQEIPSSDYLHW